MYYTPSAVILLAAHQLPHSIQCAGHHMSCPIQSASPLLLCSTMTDSLIWAVSSAGRTLHIGKISTCPYMSIFSGLHLVECPTEGGQKPSHTQIINQSINLVSMARDGGGHGDNCTTFWISMPEFRMLVTKTNIFTTFNRKPVLKEFSKYYIFWRSNLEISSFQINEMQIQTESLGQATGLTTSFLFYIPSLSGWPQLMIKSLIIFVTEIQP